MPNVGEGVEGSKANCHVCTYAAILHVLHMYPKTENAIICIYILTYKHIYVHIYINVYGKLPFHLFLPDQKKKKEKERKEKEKLGLLISW